MNDDAFGDDELAALYDLFHFDSTDDVAIYEQFARRGGTPSLELGAGSGRVALRLARAGLEVVAIDSAPPMLRRLHNALDAQTAKRLRVIAADMRAFDLGERFDLVYCAANSFQHLVSTDDQLAALGCVARHLTPQGVFVAELKAIGALDWNAHRGEMRLRETRTDPETGERVMLLEAASSSLNEQRSLVTWCYDRVASDGGVRRRAFEVTLRIFGRYEFEMLLQRAGLRLAQVYGGADLSPFTSLSDTMVIVAEAEAS